MTDEITIPTDMLPSDGRFGSGPSRIRPAAIGALVESSRTYLGTSHRKPAVINTIKDMREQLATLFSLPDGYEVIFGNGGTTAFWDIAVHSLISEKSEHVVFGEFSSRFSEFAGRAPFLKEPTIVKSEMGTHPEPEVRDDVDTYALIHNETSTGVCASPVRPKGIRSDALTIVDATSAAGGMIVNVAECDAYYFAPQKCFGADGGTWFALMSPAALERAQQLHHSGRYIPTTLDLTTHIENSRANTTYNTPSLVTVMLTLQQAKWINENGGLEWAAARSKQMSDAVYSWADNRDFASTYVAKKDERSPVTCTIDFTDNVDATVIAGTLRKNGIVDTDGYRKLGRNQLRIATFPGIEPDDIDALLACIDYVVEQL